MGMDGYVEDGSQRSFFPNGLHMHVYAETLLNRDADFDEIVKDYLQHAYGANWEQAKDYFSQVNEAFDYQFLCGEKSVDGVKGTVFRPAPGSFYNPAMAEKFAKAKGLAAEARALYKKNAVQPTRPQVISWRLLMHHAEYIEELAAVMGEKCVGNDALSVELFDAFATSFGRHEFEIERYFDHTLATGTYLVKVHAPKRNAPK
jgi:hypothetical protein